MNPKKTLFRGLYKTHTYAGIFVAIHFAIFAVSGLILLFKDELQGQETSAATLSQQTPDDVARTYERALTTAREKFPNEQPLAIFPTDDDETILSLRLGANGSTKLRGARRFDFDSIHQQEVSTQRVASGFFDWLLRLHRELLMGSTGKLYVGFVGLAYVFMLISGFFIYGKFMKGRPLGDLRIPTVPRLIDLHKFVGVVTFGWGFVVGLTGVFLAFNSVLIKLFLAQSLQHLALQYQGTAMPTGQLVPISQVIATVLNTKPHSVVTYVSFPNTEFGIPGQYLVLTNGTDTVTQRLSEMVVVNANTGLLTETISLPFYLKIVLLSEPLHFGDYGGVFLKALWAIFAVCSLAVAAFGVASYALKRAKFKSKRVQKHIHENARRQHRPYLVPITIALATIFAMVVSLFTEGTVGQFSAAVLVVPILIIFLKSRRKAKGDL